MNDSRSRRERLPSPVPMALIATVAAVAITLGLVTRASQRRASRARQDSGESMRSAAQLDDQTPRFLPPAERDSAIRHDHDTERPHSRPRSSPTWASYVSHYSPASDVDDASKIKRLPPVDGPPQSTLGEVVIPLAGPQLTPDLHIEQENGLTSLVVQERPLKEVLTVLARAHKLNLVCSNDIKGDVTVTLSRVSLPVILDALLQISGYTWSVNNGIIHVTSVGSKNDVQPATQGRIVRVFELDFASATDVDAAVKGLMSSGGQSFVTESSNSDSRRSKELLVVEDLPSYVTRVAQYVAHVDQPPRQVAIEVHVLQVDLDDQGRHGINFEHLSGASPSVSVRAQGFANATAPQAFFLELSGGDLTGLLEALRTKKNTKTLASPRILAVNGQNSRIQIGSQLGFRVTTTTETSTLESVDFINVGVVLDVTARISRDNRVLMHVKPDVSTGQVNPSTGLPEEETTEVETDVLLNDGQGMVIGGLIQETDGTTVNKVPILGDLKWVGGLFRQKTTEKVRNEIVIALIPRILPYRATGHGRHLEDWGRVRTPLFEPRNPTDCPEQFELFRQPRLPATNNFGGYGAPQEVQPRRAGPPTMYDLRQPARPSQPDAGEVRSDRHRGQHLPSPSRESRRPVVLGAPILE